MHESAHRPKAAALLFSLPFAGIVLTFRNQAPGLLGRIQNICCDEIDCARPALGSVTGDTHNIMTLAEQSSGETTAEYATGPSDRDSH